jgi:hypothetical protein
MFFMMGINEGRKELNYHQMIVCNHCGAYGQYQVFMTYMVLSLFFIPCFKWNRQYFVQTTCCNTIYRLNPESGKRIAKGENVEIRPEHLQGMERAGSRIKRCGQCGFATTEDFEYCPKCGNRF